ncbi:non-ribosomal peptide synthetase [Actinophytocola sp.]|uniref:non-ribosomal peptide synthetase n=1 Tax=Actinophytocola sp. TaxID=1872138 RepID=UPI00389B1611
MSDITVAELLARQAAERPNRPAITAPDGTTVTYGELAGRAADTTETLHWAGFGRGDRVALALPGGADMAAVLVSVMHGAVAVPLDSSCGVEELAGYLKAAGARAVVVDLEAPAGAVEAAESLGLALLATSGGEPPRLVHGARSPVVRELPEGDDDALVLHTSGTTGHRKVVPLQQTGVVLSARNIAAGLALTEEDRCLNALPLFHAHALLTPLLATLSAGGEVVCLPRFESGRFLAALRTFQPSWYSAVPTVHQAILRDARDLDGVRLRFVRSASAPLPERVSRLIEETFRAPVIEAYGMTETTSVVASNPLPPAGRKPGSVGLPIGCEIAVLDEEGRPLPPGQVGEVAVRGRAVARGQAGADGWFHTGDLGRRDEDGYLFLAGRTKEIVNRGGVTVSPFETDQVVQACPGVAQAVAFPVPHPTLGEDLVVAVVPEPGAALTEGDVRRFAMARLRRAMVPSRVVIVDDIPKAPNGKVQRLRLHEQIPLPAARFSAPVGETQAELVAIWRQVLGVDRVGARDNFFDLGGDSLAAARLCELVAARTGAQVSTVDVFAFPTVTAFAEFLQDRVDADNVRADNVRAGRGRLARLRGGKDAR